MPAAHPKNVGTGACLRNPYISRNCMLRNWNVEGLYVGEPHLWRTGSLSYLIMIRSPATSYPVYLWNGPNRVFLWANFHTLLLPPVQFLWNPLLHASNSEWVSHLYCIVFNWIQAEKDLQITESCFYWCFLHQCATIFGTEVIWLYAAPKASMVKLATCNGVNLCYKGQ